MKLDGIHQWGDGYYVCFSIPANYNDWFNLYNKFRGKGYELQCVMNPNKPYVPFAFIKFEAVVDALEFYMKEL
jgi:hypothetical protein